MATTTIFENFTVADGTVINAPSNGRASYTLYKSSTYMADLQSSVPMLIRSYLHLGATPLINNTSIFLVTFENTIRWKKTSSLNAGTAVYLIGHLLGRHNNNLPLLNIEDITFYAATNGWETGNLKAKQHAGTFSDPITLSSGY
ncbi:hypothetical protein M422DRAFT_260716 [Sphaerobolus stellatus SS14]|uniref:Unplaced genomic scaffold SPHSTscaffold_99, whole genome shotgun sequence n=1 Tax=Sphaerobolus stellatus (strain SS14) TaxID=990650 RepID=A0A0C9V5G5_SPHS4|nr:hypothetical protein M422DRAFT_260716 [Sphaerobolus stellatus SS14]